ncbi:MAG TPA: HEAT repeat domain-containing protein, partial [Dehalococcoidia bacterium]|nr:HEAT repeat domain-containing protein [Dehalococcoidia bacterium]
MAGTLSLVGCGDGSQVDLRAAIIDAEDARAAGPDGLEPLEQGLASTNTDIQRLAVRSVGRLEQPQSIGLIAPLLASSDAGVRAEAVNALGQAVFGTDGDGVADLLFAHLANESDPSVRGVVGRTLGRIQYRSADRESAAEQMLAQLTQEPGLPTLTGAVLGLESQSRGLGSGGLSDTTVDRLEELAMYGRSGAADSDGAARVRRTAMLALSWHGNPSAAAFEAALEDDDPDVRRIAVTIAGREAASEVGPEFLEQGLDDASPR